MPATTINGNVYSVPSIRSMSISTGLSIDEAIVKEYNIDVDAIKEPEELTPIFERIKADRPDQALVYSNSTQRSIYDNAFTDFDVLNDGIGVLSKDGLTVVNHFDTDEYEQDLKTIRDWYNKGYILQDNATNEDFLTLHAQGQLIGSFQLTQPGAETSFAQFIGGVPQDTIILTEPMLTTVQVASLCHGFAYQLRKPGKNHGVFKSDVYR